MLLLRVGQGFLFSFHLLDPESITSPRGLTRPFEAVSLVASPTAGRRTALGLGGPGLTVSCRQKTTPLRSMRAHMYDWKLKGGVSK